MILLESKMENEMRSFLFCVWVLLWYWCC